MSKGKVITLAIMFVGMVSLAVGGWAWAQPSSSEQEHRTVEQLIDTLAPELSTEQETILADGVVTREEYDATLDLVEQCLEAGGLTVHREIGTGPGGVDALLTESPASAGSPMSLVLDCYDRYQGKLSMVWAEQNRPTADELAAHTTAVDSCLAAKGFTPKPLRELFGEAGGASAYSECLATVGPPGSAPP